jgi:hypothetical protein
MFPGPLSNIVLPPLIQGECRPGSANSSVQQSSTVAGSELMSFAGNKQFQRLTIRHRGRRASSREDGAFLGITRSSYQQWLEKGARPLLSYLRRKYPNLRRVKEPT